MLVKTIQNIFAFEANDKTIIKEILHPKNDLIELGYSLAHGSLPARQSSLPHCLAGQSEVYLFLRGQGRMVIGDEERNISGGDVVHVPVGARQYVENQEDEPLEFFCIVSPPWIEEDDLVL